MTERSTNHAAAIAYLCHDPYGNRELLIALYYEVVLGLHIARRGSAVVGALVRSPAPIEQGSDWIRLDADDADAVHQLLSMIDVNERLVFSVHRPWIGEILAQHYGVIPTTGGIYGYLIDKTQLRPNRDPQARLLTDKDIELIDRSVCGWTRGYFERLLREQRSPWAIIRNDQIVCRASSGFPHEASEEVVGVWTHPRWRRRGFARDLVASLVADILQRTTYAVYTTTFDNHASQAVARAVGFQQCFAATTYQRPVHQASPGRRVPYHDR